MNFLTIIILLSIIGRSDTKLSTVLDVISFGMDVYKFFDALDEDEPKQPESVVDYDRIIDTLSERIKASEESVVHQIKLESHLSDLRDVTHYTQQLLKAVENIISANSLTKRQKYISRFLEDFKIRKSDVHKIKTILTIKVSGDEQTLLNLITKEYNCGMTDLENFEAHYMMLVSDIIALDLLYEKLSNTSLYHDTLESWKRITANLLNAFNGQKRKCSGDFRELFLEDLTGIDNAVMLSKTVRDRYSNKHIDIFSINGTFCFRILKSYQNIFEKDSSGGKLCAIFNSENVTVDHRMEKFNEIFEKADFTDCGKAAIIIDWFEFIGYDLLFLMMYPIDNTGHFANFLSTNTTAMATTVILEDTTYEVLFYIRNHNESAPKFLNSDYLFFHDKPVSSANAFGDSFSTLLVVLFGFLFSIFFNIFKQD